MEMTPDVAVNDTPEQHRKDFAMELEQLINRHSVENASDTPEFILAQYIQGCLDAFSLAVRARDKWYGDTRWK